MKIFNMILKIITFLLFYFFPKDYDTQSPCLGKGCVQFLKRSKLLVGEYHICINVQNHYKHTNSIMFVSEIMMIFVTEWRQWNRIHAF